MRAGMFEGKDYRVFFQPAHIETARLIEIDYRLGRTAIEDGMGINKQLLAALLTGDAEPLFFGQFLFFHLHHYNKTAASRYISSAPGIVVRV